MPAAPRITVETLVKAPIEKVWTLWTAPEHIMQWNSASDDWHTPRAAADLREGGAFSSRMEAKDGSVGFDFSGTFTKVTAPTQLGYSMSDGRTVLITFEQRDGGTFISESFDAEGENPVELQRQGWQAILEHFKKYAEAQG